MCDTYIRLFFKSKLKKFQFFFASSEKSHLSARVMARTVQLLGMTRTVLLNNNIVLLKLKSGQLIANQILEFWYSYSKNKFGPTMLIKYV